MRKIPTLFQRDENDRRYVTREINPACAWVPAGEGKATRKFDGTCVKYDGALWWARREVKPGKQSPAGFVREQYDAETGKTVGWEPADQSAFWKYLSEAIQRERRTVPGTYELCGPKVNGNPEGYPHHVLITHGVEEMTDFPRDFDGMRGWLAESDFEGVVWHHPDGRMVKIKKRDFTTPESTDKPFTSHLTPHVCLGEGCKRCPPKNTDPWPLTQCIDWDCERAWDEQGEPDGYWRCGTCPYCLATPESTDKKRLTAADYFATVRSLTDDPVVLAAVDKAEAATRQSTEPKVTGHRLSDRLIEAAWVARAPSDPGRPEGSEGHRHVPGPATLRLLAQGDRVSALETYRRMLLAAGVNERMLDAIEGETTLNKQYVLILSDYEADLMQMVRAAYRPYEIDASTPPEDTPIKRFNSGDWIGQLHWKLEAEVGKEYPIPPNPVYQPPPKPRANLYCPDHCAGHSMVDCPAHPAPTAYVAEDAHETWLVNDHTHTLAKGDTLTLPPNAKVRRIS